MTKLNSENLQPDTTIFKDAIAWQLKMAYEDRKYMLMFNDLSTDRKHRRLKLWCGVGYSRMNKAKKIAVQRAVRSAFGDRVIEIGETTSMDERGVSGCLFVRLTT